MLKTRIFFFIIKLNIYFISIYPYFIAFLFRWSEAQVVQSVQYAWALQRRVASICVATCTVGRVYCTTPLPMRNSRRRALCVLHHCMLKI